MGDQHKLCDDVLVEIFVKLPVKAVFRFKRLSKKWNHLLSTRGFREDHESRRFLKHNDKNNLPLLPLWGFFRELNSSSNFCFIPACLDSMPIRSKEFFHNIYSFLAVSNGVILCKGYRRNTYIVCNPITGQYLELPTPPNSHMQQVTTVVSFLYEEIRHQPAFTVVRADTSYRLCNYSMTIETYNSDKGVWDESTLWGCDYFWLFHMGCSLSQVIGNTIYWCGYASRSFNQGVFVAYNFKKLGEKRVHLIQLEVMQVKCVLGESREGNLLCAADNDGYSPGYNICMLKDKLEYYSYDSTVPYTEWVPILELVTENIHQYPVKRHWLIGFHPQDSRFVLMRCDSTIYWCNIELREIIRSIWLLDVPLVLPYTESLIPFFHPTDYWPPLL